MTRSESRRNRGPEWAAAVGRKGCVRGTRVRARGRGGEGTERARNAARWLMDEAGRVLPAAGCVVRVPSVARAAGTERQTAGGERSNVAPWTARRSRERRPAGRRSAVRAERQVCPLCAALAANDAPGRLWHSGREDGKGRGPRRDRYRPLLPSTYREALREHSRSTRAGFRIPSGLFRWGPSVNSGKRESVVVEPQRT